MFFILLSPFIFWVFTTIMFNLLAVENERIKTINSIIIGIFFFLAFWAFYFL